MKIIDKTSKQNLSYQDCKFWNNYMIRKVIEELILNEKEIVITDDLVERYNELANQNKSNASFVRQVKKLDKQDIFRSDVK